MIRLSVIFLSLLALLAGSDSWARHGRGGASISGGGPSGYYQTVSVNSTGQFLNGHGTAIQLRGVGLTGLETSSIEGASTPWGYANWNTGGSGATAGAPPWSWFGSNWGPTIIRCPLTAQSFLGLTVANTETLASITFTSIPAMGSTGGTLTANWAYASGQYPIEFTTNNSDPSAYATFTNGSTAVTWPAFALNTAAPNTSATVVGWNASSAFNAAGPLGTAGYQAAIVNVIQSARSIGSYIDFDLHWTSPTMTFGGTTYTLANNTQTAFSDANGLAFWEAFLPWLADNFGSAAFNTANGYNGGAAGTYYNSSYGGSSGFNDVVFELYNEPFVNNQHGGVYTTNAFTTSQNSDVALLSGGWNYYITNQTQSGTNFVFAYPWELTGYQQVVNFARTGGFTNLIIVNGNSYTQLLNNYTAYTPTDTLTPAQIAYGYHGYPNQNTNGGTFSTDYPAEITNPYPQNGHTSGNTPTPSSIDDAIALAQAGKPLIWTENGAWGGTSATNGEPYQSFIQTEIDAYGMSTIPWAMTGNNAYNTAVTSTGLNQQGPMANDFLPVLGEGVIVQNWMTAHPTFPVQVAATYTQPYYNSNGPHSFTVNIPSGANLGVLAMQIGNGSGASDASGITVGGAAMTEVPGSWVAHNYEGQSFWTIANPTSGSSVTVTVTGSTGGEQMFTFTSFANAGTVGTVTATAAAGRSLAVTGSGAVSGGYYLCTGIMDATAVALGNYPPVQLFTADGDSPTSKITWGGLSPYTIGQLNLTSTGSGGDGWAAGCLPINPQ